MPTLLPYLNLLPIATVYLLNYCPALEDRQRILRTLFFPLQLIIKSATFFLLHAQLIKDDFQRAKPGNRGL
jgi:hypothetical protein